MSLPPETITIKRKIGSEHAPPVNFLRVQEPKRQRSGNWLYQRKEAVLQSPEYALGVQQQDTRPVIHTSRPVGKNGNFISTTDKTALARQGLAERSIATPSAETAKVALPSGTPAEPRRFYMTKSRANILSTSTPGGHVVGRKSRHATLFVERSPKRKRTSAATQENQREDTTRRVIQATHTTPAVSIDDADEDMEDVEPRRLKRPGATARTRQPEGSSEAASKPQPQLPPSLLNRRDASDMDQLAREMDDYTLQQIGYNLARLNDDNKKSEQAAKVVSSPASKKYRPKAPTQRYAERHPEQVPKLTEPEDISMSESDSDEGDYVIETFIRIPAGNLAASAPPEQFGLLVFDTEPDIEFFYGAESDSDEEKLEDDEDSNAEDYYRADYPDDEVDSDDEYDRDPYIFRTRNASDLEEYDQEEEAYSDEETLERARSLGVIHSPDLRSSRPFRF
ncbi:hypothetical protein VTK73DRAFT_872 [Phialemonium thermophilum]|uniref:Transcription factor Iwr1 domain-containing protein n=1 Tax=Phialemonium thermophilum TaxID=223376 RepID=A0ABR3Y4L8_9PEZI